MLLAVDIGNTNTVLGLFVGEDLRHSWRIETRIGRTMDELLVLLGGLFGQSNCELKDVSGCILSSVVPTSTPQFVSVAQRLGTSAIIVGPGLKTGMRILYENPKEVGADRIVNAVAAYNRYRSGCVVVDFGTATTFDVITPKGEYLGGIISTGLQVSADALYRAAAKLPRVALDTPASVVGKTTEASMQSGLVYGYVGLVDGLVMRVKEELDFEVRCLATGGLAQSISEVSTHIEDVDEFLTLKGLRLIYQRNQLQ